jgi:UrcA family protein
MPAHRTLIAVAATAVAGLLTSVAASAAEHTNTADIEHARVTVHYGDLNLDTDSGVQRLQRRLVAAAREVCGRPDPRNLRLASDARKCFDQAMVRAVAEVGNTRLAQLNAGRGKSLRG